MRRIPLLVLVLFLAQTGLAWSVDIAVLGDETVDFSPLGADNEQVRGYLSKPAGHGPFPAAVLLHGCSGPGKYLGFWKQYFLKIGVACLVVDSFGPRGFKEICTEPGRVTTSTRIGDAYGALEYLAKRPDVKPDQVIVAGFSHGGGVALDVASSVGLSKRKKGAPAFKAAVSIFPGCNHKGRMEAKYQLPVLILIGEDDDWTPAKYCQALVDTRQQGEGPMFIKTYPGAHHGFTTPFLPRTYKPNVRNKHSPTGKGATLAGDPEATADAQNQIESFVRRFVLAPGK